MKRLLLPLIATIALPNVINANAFSAGGWRLPDLSKKAKSKYCINI